MTDTLTPERRAEERTTPDRRRQMRDVFVEFRDVHKAYGPKPVLRGVNLKVYRGEVLVILGGSGTGKSVTLRHMPGLDPITAQKINELIIDLQSKLNVTSVVVTHDIQSAFSVGDRIAFLNRGVFEWVGTMEEARNSDHPVLRDFLRSSMVTAAQPG